MEACMIAASLPYLFDKCNLSLDTTLHQLIFAACILSGYSIRELSGHGSCGDGSPAG